MRGGPLPLCHVRAQPRAPAVVLSEPGLLTFATETTATIEVPDHETRGLDEWLLSEASDAVLLGTPGAERRDDGAWTVKQQPVNWFGLDVTPVFIEYIDRGLPTASLAVEVRESYMEVPPTSRGLNRMVADVMGTAGVSGSSVVSWSRVDGAESKWHLTSTTALTLSLNVRAGRGRRLVESAGSRIVRVTTSGRTEAYVRDISAAYSAWARCQTGDGASP